MEIKSFGKFFTPALLAVIIFSSDFLNSNLFAFDDNHFAVWFVVSILCFACGWFIDRSIGWNFGGKVVFATTIAAVIVSIFVIIFFKEYFNANELLTENLILFSLRNITLGAMAIFGMAIAEVTILEKDIALIKERLAVYEDLIKNAKKEAELELKDAQIKAQKIINDAELNAKNIFLKKERIEHDLKEFIRIENELIKKYEESI